MKHEFEITRLVLFIQICTFQIYINNTKIKGKIYATKTRLVALSGQFLCVYDLCSNSTENRIHEVKGSVDSHNSI